MPMSLPALIAIFIGSFTAIAFASAVLTEKFERVGHRLHLPQALLGIVTGLAANAAGITSAIFAFSMHHNEIGYGVIIGSNIINLAGLLGMSAVIAGEVRVGFHGLLLSGGVNFLTTVIMTLLLLSLLPIEWTLFLLVLLLFPYLYLISRQTSQIETMKIPQGIKKFLTLSIVHVNEVAKERKITKASFLDLLIAAFSFMAIVAGSFALVTSAIDLAQIWRISYAIVGSLILAGLTSIPNIISAILLARDKLGSAVVSETFNSNISNLLTGICLPVLLFGLGKVSKRIEFSIFWLLGMTLIAIAGLSLKKGMHRLTGIGIISLYTAFALFIIFATRS